MTTEKKGKMGPMNATIAEEEETLYSLSLSSIGIGSNKRNNETSNQTFCCPAVSSESMAHAAEGFVRPTEWYHQLCCLFYRDRLKSMHQVM